MASSEPVVQEVHERSSSSSSRSSRSSTWSAHSASQSSVTTIASTSSSTQNSAQNENDSFFMSTATVPDNEDSSAPDLERHPKGKRKRTVAKDKAVLEDAYRSNPKPDKVARHDIVNRVSLNEKEVQIWFQNRRQNDRRKCRPLSPQEIAALRSGSMQILSADASVFQSYATLDKTPIPAMPGPLLSPLACPDAPATRRESASSSEGQMVRSDSGRTTSSDEGSARAGARPGGGNPGQNLLSSSWSGGIGYLSNRWNLGTSFPPVPSSTLLPDGSDGSCRRINTPSTTAAASAPSGSSNPASHFRLSLSLEGKAELVSTRTVTPLERSTDLSQPLPQPRPSGLQRSASLSLPLTSSSVGFRKTITLPPISALTGSLPSAPPRQRLHRGRSRDAQAWELCCDSDVRDELTAHAENEASGSALAAIGLLRSTCGGIASNVLRPLLNASKRNAPLGRAGLHPAPSGSGFKRPRIGRCSTAVGRIQNGPEEKPARQGDGPKRGVDDVAKIKVSMLLSPSGDSDKENCSPTEDRIRIQQPRPRRPLPSTSSLMCEREPTVSTAAASRAQPLAPLASLTPYHNARHPNRLGDVLAGFSATPLLMRAHTAPSLRWSPGKRAAARVEIWEDSGAEDDGDGSCGGVGDAPRKRRAWHGEGGRLTRGDVEVSPSKRPDMDCVAGLLSLSQGNWK